MHRLPRALAAVTLTAAISAVAPGAGAATSRAAFCSKVKAHNTTLQTAYKKNPRDRAGLTTLRVQGWAALAKSAPTDVGKGLQNMASALKQGFPPAPADMAVALPYIEQTCKVTLA